MGTYDGGQAPVDSSTWKRPVSSKGDASQAPKETYTREATARSGSTGTGIRTGKATPEPESGAIVRNFGYGGGQ